MHNYTKDQLEDIASKASELISDLIIPSEVEAVLDSLPEEEQQWVPVSVHEIEKDDEIQVVGDGWHYEFTVHYPSADTICCHPRTGSQITKENFYQYDLKIYRKVKPIVHPDPRHQIYIGNVVVEGKTESFDLGVWNGSYHYNLYRVGEMMYNAKPEEIIEFQEAVITLEKRM